VLQFLVVQLDRRTSLDVGISRWVSFMAHPALVESVARAIVAVTRACRSGSIPAAAGGRGAWALQDAELHVIP
jgi:hypothetical protein